MLDQIATIVPPPSAPLGTGSSDGWAEVQTALGIAMPEDYRAFITAYGHGEFDDRFMVHSPFLPDNSIDPSVNDSALSSYTAPYQESQRRLRDAGFGPPFPIFPEPGGLLCCASSSIGVGVYWVTDPVHDPSDWPVLYESEGPWYRHDAGVVSLLFAMLAGQLGDPTSPLHSLFDRKHPAFVPVV